MTQPIEVIAPADIRMLEQAVLTDSNSVNPTIDQLAAAHGAKELEVLLGEAPEAELDFLNGLLAESEAEVADKAVGKSLRKELARTAAGAERDYIQAKLNEWETRREWDTISNCALFTRFWCNCDSEECHEVFRGLFYHQRHRTMRTVKRWISATQFMQGTLTTAALAALPNEVLYEDVMTDMCAECAEAKGFDLSKGTTQWKL